MRFLHLGDLHLGKIVNEISMIPDQAYMLDQILDLAKDRKADAVLIAGDIYDKSIPSEEAVKLLDGFLSRLANENIAVIAISGNHDSDERLHFGSSLFTYRNVFITGRYEGSIPCTDLQDEYGTVHFMSLPFVKASLVRHFYPDGDTDTYDAAVRTALAAADVNTAERNVLLAHQFVTSSGKDPETAGSENVMSDNVGTIEKVDVSAFDAFDYLALGHIHRPQRVGRDTARYAGSILKYSLSEIGHNKSVPLVTMKEKGNIEVELIPLKPLRDMRRIKGKLEDLVRPENITDPNDYIYAVLTDEETIPDAIGRLRTYYPNTMKLSYDNSHTRALENYDPGKITEKATFRELMTDFYQTVKGGEPTEEEWKILIETAGKAGVTDEA